MAVLAFLAISLVSPVTAGAHTPAYTEEQALKCVLGEARGEPYEGQVAVGEVLRRSPKIPYYGAQTIRVSGGNWYASEKEKWVRLPEYVVKRARKAWLESATSNFSRGATHFEGDAFKKPLWAENMKLVAHIGHQQFFKEV